MAISRYIIFCIYLFIGGMQLLVGLRFLLKIFNPQANSSWIMEWSNPFVRPFETFLPSADLNGIFNIELASIFALIVYTFIGYFLLGFISKRREMALRRKHRN